LKSFIPFAICAPISYYLSSQRRKETDPCRWSNSRNSWTRTGSST
jgi:hypothetical protein